MKILFSHGQESGPWGIKIQRLAKIAEGQGVKVESVDYTDTMDPDIRVARLLGLLGDDGNQTILVGSSMGGYVSVVASKNISVRGVFLMAPALYIPRYRCQAYPTKALHLEIVHGWHDDIIPVENSIRFAKEFNHSLHLVPGNHGLSDALETVDLLFFNFLKRVL